MENENVIGKVCFAILRKGFVAGLRISLELDSPGCIIGCKFDGAGIVGNTVIDDSDILLHITSHGIQTEKGHTTGDRSVFYIGVGAALKLSGRRKIENVSRAAGACAHFEPVGCLYITGCFQRKKRCCGDFRIMQRCGKVIEVLKTIVFDYAGYANERDHVQKIVEQHYWLFGEQYHLVTADKRMQKALEEYLYLL